MADNRLLVESGNIALVTGVFGTVTGMVQPAGDVTLGGNGYIVTGAAATPHAVTINGTAQVSGYFSSLTINEGATVTITGDTYISNTITQKTGSTLTVNQNVTLCVGGNSVKPAAQTTIPTWGTLPAGTYNAASGNWTLGGDVTVVSTSCAIDATAGHSAHTDLIPTLNGKTLTVHGGTVKASGTGTVIGVGGNATLDVFGTGVKAYGAFSTITFEADSSMTVPENQTISATYSTNFYSVKVLQDTVFTAFEGVLPTRNATTEPLVLAYQFANLIGDWTQGTNNTNPGEGVNNTETVVGDNTTLTVTQNYVTIRGNFEQLNTGDHTVTLAGDTVINSGTYKIKGGAGTHYSLTVNGGTATVSGELKQLIVNGGTVTDETGDGNQLEIDNTGVYANNTAIVVTDGTLTLSNTPEIKINGGSLIPAISVTGGTLNLENGAVEAWGTGVHAVDVSGGSVFIGKAVGDVMPKITSHDADSVCLFVNNGGVATVYDGELLFNDANSIGVRVNDNGTVKLYPNDEFSLDHLTGDLRIYIHGTTGTKAAMWVNVGGAFEIRGRGARLDQPYRDDGTGYALYIHNEMKSGVLAGGTFNGEVYYQFDGNTQKRIASLMPINHYLRYDVDAEYNPMPNYGASDGSYGILPEGEYTDSFRYGNYVTKRDAVNPFNEVYQDRFGASGTYYSIVDAEWELRYRMENSLNYQLPAGIMKGDGEVTNTLTLDGGNVDHWAIGKKQGDLNVTGSSRLYLAGRTLTYNSADLSGVDAGKKQLLTDTDKDNLHTVAVTGSLTVIDAVSGGAGTDQSGNKFSGGYIGTGTIEYTGTAADETAAIHVCGGKLNVVSAKLRNVNTTGSASGVYIHGGTANFGTVLGPGDAYSGANENNDNAIITVNGTKQALKVETSGIANVYGGSLMATAESGASYGAAITGGTLNVKGGLLSGNNANNGYGVYATGGMTTIEGGCFYGTYAADGSNGTSLCVAGGTVNLRIDAAHQSYTTEATDQTSNTQHINNIRVSSGTLNIGTLGAPDNYLHNNGTLTVEGGTTYYFDGTTVGDTTVYGATAGSAGASFTTQFYVEDGDFGALNVFNLNNAPLSAENSYSLDSLRSSVQLHGGYFESVEVNVTVKDATSNVQDLIGVWASKDHDGDTSADWARYNHYAELVSSTRDSDGKWPRVSSIQSGTAQTDNVQQVSETGKAVSIRNAADEFKTWAKGTTSQTFKLYANLWLDDDAMCSAEYCGANHSPVTVANGAHTLDLNGFGIFGDQTAAILSVGSGGALTVQKGTADAADAYADRIRNFNNGVALDVLSGGALTIDGAKINSNSGTAITTAGTTTVKSGTITGSTNGVAQSDGALSITGGTITGGTNGLNRTGAAADNLHFITGGTFSSVTTSVTGEKLADLLAAGKTFRDNGDIEAGLDVLNRQTIVNAANSGDAATGGESVKYDGSGNLQFVAYDTKLANNFTVTDRTVSEVTLTANANAGIALALTKAVTDDATLPVKNETKTLYLVKDGGSAVATITPDANYCTGIVTLNGSASDALSHKSAAVTKTLTAADSSLTVASQLCHIDESIASVINVAKGAGNVYTLTGTNLAMPAVQKVDISGNWVSATDVTITGDSSSYTVDFPDTLATDYRLTATIISSGGGGGAAPATTVTVSGDENSVSLSVTTNSGVATMSEPKAAGLEKVIGQSVETGEVTIDMSGLSSGIATAAIPTATVKAIEAAVASETNDADELTIKLPDGSVTFDAAALATIADQAKGSDLKLTVDSVAASTLSAAQRDAVKDVDTQAVYSITLVSGTTTISDFKGGTATVSVPYTLKAGQSARGLVVWYVANDGKMTEVPATFAAGKVTFTVAHFSNYVIAYDAERAAACPQDSTCPMAKFTDLGLSEWYHDGVHWALDNGVMNGVGDGKFAPSGTVTRGMVMTMLARMEGVDTTAGEGQTWYDKGVAWAMEKGISDGTNPTGAVTREQFATMLYRFAQYKKVDVSVGEDTNILSYDDAFGVSEWAMSAMQWAVGSGVINGIGSNLEPAGNATRAQVATMLMRYSTAK